MTKEETEETPTKIIVSFIGEFNGAFPIYLRHRQKISEDLNLASLTGKLVYLSVSPSVTHEFIFFETQFPG